MTSYCFTNGMNTIPCDWWQWTWAFYNTFGRVLVILKDTIISDKAFSTDRHTHTQLINNPSSQITVTAMMQGYCYWAINCCSWARSCSSMQFKLHNWKVYRHIIISKLCNVHSMSFCCNESSSRFLFCYRDAT